MVSLYLIQIQEGRLFLHEHPTGATNWDLEQIKELEREADVNLYTVDLIFAKKTMRFITNSFEIDMELQKKCNEDRVHQELAEGSVKWTARYPRNLCRAICKGLLREIRNDVQ